MQAAGFEPDANVPEIRVPNHQRLAGNRWLLTDDGWQCTPRHTRCGGEHGGSGSVRTNKTQKEGPPNGAPCAETPPQTRRPINGQRRGAPRCPQGTPRYRAKEAQRRRCPLRSTGCRREACLRRPPEGVPGRCWALGEGTGLRNERSFRA